MASSSDRSSERGRRRPTQAMATQGGKNPPPSRQPKSPAISLPKSRLAIGGSLALLIVIAGIIAAPLFRNETPAPLDNAIWLGKSWTYANRDESEITDLAAQLQQYQIGKVYAYVSTLNISSRWSSTTLPLLWIMNWTGPDSESCPRSASTLYGRRRRQVRLSGACG